MRNRIISIVLIFIITILFLSGGCKYIYDKYENNLNSSNNLPTIIGEIAYDENSPWGYRIYIEENGELTPFIVLTSNYKGNCLVLREFLLQDLHQYNWGGEFGAYYNGSTIDKFLNQNYYSRLSQDIRSLIVTSEIEITSKDAIDTHNNDIEIIKRSIFLLSANEVNVSLSKIALKEGETLTYFKKVQNRIATFENFEKCSWWLRTPALRNGDIVIAIGDDGIVGMGGINTIAGASETGVRPAFCVPANTHIIFNNDDIHGNLLFTIR